jgi:glycosyltransferase involved in cell wall biosynthesis
MLTRRVLGGTLGPIDFLTRSHVYLLQAVERLLREDPSLRARLRVVFAGAASDADTAQANLDVVEWLGYLSHVETVELMRAAGLLFLPMQDLPVGTRARIVPGKTYEYLAARRPILAAVPDGDARDLVAQAESSLVCRPADVDCLARSIREELTRHERGELRAPAPDAVLQRYERRALTAELAELLDEVTASAAARSSRAG